MNNVGNLFTYKEKRFAKTYVVPVLLCIEARDTEMTCNELDIEYLEEGPEQYVIDTYLRYLLHQSSFRSYRMHMFDKCAETWERGVCD